VSKFVANCLGSNHNTISSQMDLGSNHNTITISLLCSLHPPVRMFQVMVHHSRSGDLGEPGSFSLHVFVRLVHHSRSVMVQHSRSSLTMHLCYLFGLVMDLWIYLDGLVMNLWICTYGFV
jgi:hypothetical protein